MKQTPSVEIHPLTPDRWRDFAALFDTNSITRDCWCMWFREPSAAYRANKGAKNRAAFRAVVKRDVPPGVIAYVDGKPAGWCAVAPRADYTRLARSRTLAPVDDAEVWSITCFFIGRAARGRGVSRALIDAAVDLAAEHGARIVEAYPVDTSGKRIAPDAAYHGLASTFTAAGFKEVIRRSATRPIMRHTIAVRRGRARR
jgi:GNAT superfamily N-acetyltransferase